MTGRVSLKDFYTRKAVGPWMLSESPEFLRQLGSLDESSQSLGPQVIISNYIHAVSNCDNPSEYYSICCIHECQGLLNHLEVKIRAPTAAKEIILGLVMNMSSDSIEAPRNLSSGLVKALDQVATLHDGKVPLHGRLFAQWLHYAFPHECPYPYLTGKLTPLTQSEWIRKHGRDSDASELEKQNFMQAEDKIGSSKDQYMSQWTVEEEIYTSLSLPQEPKASSSQTRRRR